MIPCRIALIFSRSDSSSSSWCWPSTDRSVVCAICERRGHEVLDLDDRLLRRDDAEVRDGVDADAGTLSFVITSCGGMLSVIVRRSTRTIRSTIGIRKIRPGPLGSATRRPSRKTMPRSYSRSTFDGRDHVQHEEEDDDREDDQERRSRLDPMHVEGQAVSVRRPGPACRDRAARSSGPARARRARTRSRRCARPPPWPTMSSGPTAHRSASAAIALAIANAQKPPINDRQRDHEWNRRVVRRRRLVEERDQADRDRDEAREGQRAVRRDVRVDHEQGDTEQHEDQPAPRDRQHREAEERAHHADRAERAGDDDPGMEQLEAEPGDAGEEEQPDDVRVDQRRQETREEPRSDVDDGRTGGVHREMARLRRAPVDLPQQRRQRGCDQVDHVQPQRFRSRSCSTHAALRASAQAAFRP